MLGTMWALVGQYTAPFSPGDVTKHLRTPRLLTVYAGEGGSEDPDASPEPGRWRSTIGRNVAPPEVSSPGSFDTVHCWAALAAYLLRVRATTSVRGQTRTGRIWFKLRTAPFM